MFDYLFRLLLENFPTIFLTVLVYSGVVWLVQRPPNFPPGPLAIPLLGSPAAFAGDQEKVFPDLRRKYGDVFSFYGGPKPFIVVCGLQAITEGLVKLGYATSDRPSTFLSEHISRRKGLMSAHGPFWKEQRTFTVSRLRQFGMGKVSLESLVLEEVELLVDFLRSTDREPVDLKHRLLTGILNVILSVVYSKRFAHDDPQLLNLLASISDNFRLLTPLANIFPWMRFIPGDPFQYKQIVKNAAYSFEFLHSLIRQHKNEFHPEIIRDFTDAYLAELKTKSAETETSFSEEQLVFVNKDLMLGGTETTTSTILWGLLYLTRNPDVQRKVQEEVDSVIGSERYASVVDKPHLPYTDATLMEIQRIANIGLFLPPHSNSEDIRINGYTIPKGSSILFMFGEIMSDPKNWKHPETFDPDRFMGEQKASNMVNFLPFSLGRRSCPGEALAKMNLFLFVTTLMQRFTLKFPDGEPTPSTDRVIGFTIGPKPFKVIAIPRE